MGPGGEGVKGSRRRLGRFPHMTTDKNITYSLTAHDPSNGTEVIRAMLTKEAVDTERRRMEALGMTRIKVSETRNAAGNAG